jgi:ankyrin repeat protein
MPTKFFAAIKNGDQDEVRRLLNGAPGLIHEKEDGLSPVLIAVYHGHPEIAELLAEKTVTLTVFEAAATGREAHLARLLARDPQLVNAYSQDGYQPLGLACFFGHREAAEYLIKAGARVNSPSQNKMRVTPLHSAAAGGHTAIVKLLLQNGADPNAREDGDFTPLHAAAQNGDADSVRSLLFEGADANAKTAEGKTPMDYAVEAGKANAVDVLKKGITKKLKARR